MSFPSRIVDEILEYADYGSFQRQLLVSCGLFRSAESMQFIAVTLVAIYLQDVWNLRSIDLALIVMSINLGSLSGAPIWGIVSDKKGRKFTYLLSTILSAIAVTIAALSNSFNMLVGMQFVIGFVISGYSVCTILISEFVPTEKRGKTLAGLQIFKVIGHIFAVLLGWLLLPSYGWRVYLLVCSAPIWASVPVYFFLSESPRFLIVNNRMGDCVQVLKILCEKNGKASQEVFKDIQAITRMHHEPIVRASFASTLRDMFQPKYKRSSLTLGAIWILVGMLYYGVVVVTSTYFFLDTESYIGAFLSTFAELLSFLAIYSTVDIFSRRSVLFTTLVLAGISLIVSLFVTDNFIGGSITLICARLFSVSTMFLMYIYSTELYPTSCRNSALGTFVGISKIGFITASFVGEYCAPTISLSTLFSTAIVAAGLSYSLPIETCKSLLKDELDDESSSPRKASSMSFTKTLTVDKLNPAQSALVELEESS